MRELKREAEKYYGQYRSKVVNNKDPDKFGRVVLYIPDVMPMINENEGLWARPANNPMGGRNMEGDKDNYYTGTSFIPKNGSWVWCFFECGNINRPYYWGSLDIEHAKSLPENQQGVDYQKKWTLFKSTEGRTVVISDDSVDARVEITGKKRNISDPPSGDWDSVYKIDGNQNTILLDEVEGREKILIRTRKGDYIHVDIDEQELQMSFKNDIKIKTGGNLHLQVGQNFNINVAGNTSLYSLGDIHTKSLNFYRTTEVSTHDKAGNIMACEAGQNFSASSGGTTALDGGILALQTKLSLPAIQAVPLPPLNPQGDRET